MDDLTNSATRDKADWLPESLEAEQSLLGAAIINDGVLQAVSGLITSQDFAEPLHAYLWEVLSVAHGAGRRLDIKLLVSAIGPDADIPVGNLTAGQYVARLASEAVSLVGARDYAATIKDLSDQRRLAEIGLMLRPSSKIDPAGLAALAIDQLDGIVASRVNSGTPGLSMPEAVTRAVDEIALAYQRDGAISGITWGLKDLDSKTLGIQASELTILAGRPGMGKTAMALGVARRASMAGHRTMIQSLEMSDTPLTQRMIADEIFDDPGKPIPYWMMRSGRFREEDFARITDAARRIALLPIRIEQRPALTVSQIAAQARQEKRKNGLALLIVDHMHLIRASDRYKGNKVNELGEISGGLKALSKELDIAVLALCQLSRGVEGREDKKPNLSDLRGSGDIEQDADSVVMLYREAYYLQRSEPRAGTDAALNWMTKMDEAANRLLAIVEKQRNGPVGEVNLFCNITCNAVRDTPTEAAQPSLGI